ncbi:MAG: ZIP family metal transporter [Fidelibacterota bacterium]
MTTPWFYTFGSVVLVSLVSLVGVVALSISGTVLSAMMVYLVSFAAGTLFGSAFIYLLPEAFANDGNTILVSLLIIGGLMSFFIVEKFFRWRHCHIPTSKKHVHPIVPMNIVGDGMHNFIDGVLIAVTYAVSIPLGVATTVAVLFHEIPQEIGDFSVLIHGGLTVKKALWLNFLSSLMAVVGAIAALVFGKNMQDVAQLLIPITAGGFIYIAGSDLIPEMHHATDARKSFVQMIMMLLGVAVLTGLKLWN